MNFLELKKNYNAKKIKFNPSMKFMGGDGGSSNIIYIDSKTNYVYKIVPYFYKHPLFKYRQDNDQKEINVYKLITVNVLLKNYTPHIVGFYFNYKTPITSIFGKCPTLKEQYNKKQKDKYKTNICKLKYIYSHKMIQKYADVCVIENCKDNITEYIKNNKKNIVEIIDRILFQAIITLAILQEVFPGFTHNDFFIRNILGIIENYPKTEYIQYIYKDKHFYIPANGFYIKINDFGFTLSNSMISTNKLKVSKSFMIIICFINNPYFHVIYFNYEFPNNLFVSLTYIFNQFYHI